MSDELGVKIICLTCDREYWRNWRSLDPGFEVVTAQAVSCYMCAADDTITQDE